MTRPAPPASRFRPALGQSQKLSHHLSLTPALKQALNLLQLPAHELEAVVAQAIEENPFLERAPSDGPARLPPKPAPGPRDDGDPMPDWTERIAEGPSLARHIAAEMPYLLRSPQERDIGARLAASLTEAGYLSEDLAAIAAASNAPLAIVEETLEKLQEIEPTGLFARDLRECLFLQWKRQAARHGDMGTAVFILIDHLETLAARDWQTLMTLTGLDRAGLDRAVALLRKLDPRPGHVFDDAPPVPRIPDLLVWPTPEGGWRVEVNEAVLPKVLIDRAYVTELRAHIKQDRDARRYVRERLAAAKSLVHALDARYQTLLKVGAEIVRQQEDFLRLGVEGLRPMTLKTVAQAIGMHESTVSRASLHKSIRTPRGVFDLKSFFTSAVGEADALVSNAAIRARIQAMIAQESPTAPLSDEDLVARLGADGIRVARRTVAKYRDQLGIPGSNVRRRDKADATAKSDKNAYYTTA